MAADQLSKLGFLIAPFRQGASELSDYADDFATFSYIQ